MNIEKHKQILALRKDFSSLVEEYKAKQEKLYDVNSDGLLSLGVKDFIEYIKSIGFEVDGDESGSIRAILDEIVIRLDRKPKIITIYMPNGETYPIYVRSTSEFEMPKSPRIGLKQDDEIEQLKQNINKMKEQFTQLETQEFRYILSVEKHSQLRGVHYKEQTFINFADIIPIMFS